MPAEPPALEEIRRLVTIFRELREGRTSDGKTKLKSPTGTMSTAEAISVVGHGLALAAHFGDGSLLAGDVAAGLVGVVVKDPVQDRVVWQEYLETVVKERDGWKCRIVPAGTCRDPPHMPELKRISCTKVHYLLRRMG